MSSPGRKLRVLIVSQFYHPDVTACAFRMHETAQLLNQMNCEVHVIAGEPHKGFVEGMNMDDGDIRATRVPLIKADGSSKWNYIAHYLSFMFGAIWHSAKHRGRFDVVWASSPPLFTGISGLFIARLKKARLCLDIRDIWPESAVVAGQIRENSFLFKAAKIVEKLLYRFADQITCVAKPMASYIQSICGKQPVIIYNAIPQSMTAAGPVYSDYSDHSGSTRTILYIGNMGFCQNLSLVLDAAAILKQQQHAGIRFMLVGTGIEKKMLEKRREEMGLDNVEIKDVVSKERAIEMIRHADALMLHLKDDGTMDKTIPSKVFDYMAGGKPILYGLKGEACDILGAVGGNLYYDPAEPVQLADQAVNLRNNYESLASQASANLDLVKKEFLRERMAERLLELFRQMTGQTL